jgi:hypothetical protein
MEEDTRILKDDEKIVLFKLKAKQFVNPYCDIKGHEDDRLSKICFN